MMDYGKYKSIKVTRRGRVLTISLNYPEKLNSIDAALHKEISEIFVDVRHDDSCDVVILTGEGRAFCAGGDIEWMQLSIDQPDEFETTAREAKEIVFGQLDLDKPLICRMNGHAVGLGASLALLCDIIIASERAKIGDPHVSVGLVAGDGGALIWPQIIGYAKAKHFLMTGDLMTATEAERLGLITQVVSEDKLDDTVNALADRLANGATKAIRWTKVTANLPLKAIFHSHFDAGIAYEVVSNLSADHKEAVAAFRERRPPKFGRS